MPEIQAPDRGQPLDLSYLLTVVNEINSLNRRLATKAINQSQIKYADTSSTSNIVTSDLVFYAATNTLSPKFATGADLITRFNFSGFKTTPIVTASVQVVTGDAPPIYAVITNLNSNGCEVRLFASGTVNGDPRVNVSIIAIGEKTA